MNALLLGFLIALLPCAAFAQDARELFSRAQSAASLPPRAIGFYSRGCLAGAVALPASGEGFQLMEPGQNRNWGHPRLVALLQRLSLKSREIAGWPGLLIGDLSLPRGGPMPESHGTHQIGLDADVWLAPMPPRALTQAEREDMQENFVLVDGPRRNVRPEMWTPAHVAVIRAAAEEEEVDRIFVHAAIKKALCRDAGKERRGWLGKVIPLPGHDQHFHIRLHCPKDSPGCRPNPPLPAGDGCRAIGFAPEIPSKRKKPPYPLSALPPECKQVLQAP